MDRALYGPGGFYRSGQAAAAHFRTSAHAGSGFAAALAALLQHIDAALEHPQALDLVDVGAGDGQLLARVRALAPDELTERLHPVAVEVADPPETPPAGVRWRATLPAEVTGLVVANEWLDNIPVDVAECTGQGPRLVLVDPATGTERSGQAPAATDLGWLGTWWPAETAGERAEIGRPRDEAWADAVRRLRRGLAVAVDYAHRAGSRPPYGTLAGYRAGRAVPPVPDGSCDVTAHVALDACAAAGQAAGGHDTVLTTQREALRALGVRGERPPSDVARTDPQTYLRRLSAASQEGELLDPTGLGGFGWLMHAVGMPLPDPLRGLG